MRGAATGRRRVFVECTHTYLVGGSSGIRRVARNLANAHKAASNEEVELLPLVWAGRRFVRPQRPLSEAPHPLFRLIGSVAVCIRALAGWPLLAPLKVPVKALLCKVHQRLHGGGSVNQQEETENETDSAGVEASPSRNSDMFYRLFGLLLWPLGAPFVEPVRFRRGDLVVLVDSTWNTPAMLKALFEAREREGIVVGAMLHDLFPLTLPQMCQLSTVAGYTDWFQRVAKGVDFFITNSGATTRALELYLQKAGPARARRLPAGNFRLGAELHHQSPTLSKTVSLPSMSGFVVLAVGTIEPRKNYQVILDALDLLWETHNVSLVIVGRPGWSSEDIMARLSEPPNSGGRLLHLDNADDATLNACYKRADALVCASWAEGFGLPLVEGMRYGAPVVASDIDVFREVGGDHCRYFAPDRPEELAVKLEQLVQQWHQGTPVRQKKCDLAVSWQDSAIHFREEVLRLADAASHSTAKVSSAARSQQKSDA